MLPKLPSDEDLLTGVKEYMDVRERIVDHLQQTGMPKEMPLPANEEPDIPSGVTTLELNALGDLYDSLTSWYDTVSYHIALAETNKGTAEEQKKFVAAALHLKMKQANPGTSVADVDRLVLVDPTYLEASRAYQFYRGLLNAQKCRLSSIAQKRDRIFRELKRRENQEDKLGFRRLEGRLKDKE